MLLDSQENNSTYKINKNLYMEYTFISNESTKMVLECKVQYLLDQNPFDISRYSEPADELLTYVFVDDLPLRDQLPELYNFVKAPYTIDQVALQLSHNKRYADLDETIDEQGDIFEGFFDTPDNIIILRTDPSVRVEIINKTLLNTKDEKGIDKCMTMLKTIIETDVDLMHDFIAADGLSYLLMQGIVYEQYHFDTLHIILYLTRYIDGMQALISHFEALSWIYNLLSSSNANVQKTVLEILINFLLYSEDNLLNIWIVIQSVDENEQMCHLQRFIDILTDHQNVAESELLLTTMAFINRLLVRIENSSLFHDIVEALDRIEMKSAVSSLMNYHEKSSLLYKQLELYKLVVEEIEDGQIEAEQIEDSNRDGEEEFVVASW